jgi:tRNA threonylcarbamoyl adenosine modification protein YeaZ
MILSIEAAVAGGSISIMSDNGSLVAEWIGDSTVSRAEDLLPAVAKLLADSGLGRADISMISVASGPGSFTGIRIGLSTAIGLASGLNRPLVSVSILRAMSASIDSDRVLAAVPMGRSAICLQHFSHGEPLADPETLADANFAEVISRISGKIAIHPNLAIYCGDSVPTENLGNNLSQYVARYALKNLEHREEPLFIAKSF